MKRALSLVFTSGIIAVLALSRTPSAQTVPLLFQTTFNCPDWNQGLGLNDSDVCASGDGIAGAGQWTAGSGTQDQITAAANNPAGVGGKGFRHWRSNGSNSNGGGLTITLPKAVTEVWVRIYQRYQSGFGFSPSGQPLYVKDHYWGGCGSGCVIFGIQGSNSWGINYNGSDNHPSSLTWTASQGRATGDGQWHAYEYHVRKAGAASLIELWVDGTRYLNQAANLGTAALASFTLGSNQSSVTGCSAGCYTDYDDLAISTTGYIGPTYGGPGPGPGPAPAAPSNVHIIP